MIGTRYKTRKASRKYFVDWCFFSMFNLCNFTSICWIGKVRSFEIQIFHQNWPWLIGAISRENLEETKCFCRSPKIKFGNECWMNSGKMLNHLGWESCCFYRPNKWRTGLWQLQWTHWKNRNRMWIYDEVKVEPTDRSLKPTRFTSEANSMDLFRSVEVRWWIPARRLIYVHVFHHNFWFVNAPIGKAKRTGTIKPHVLFPSNFAPPVNAQESRFSITWYGGKTGCRSRLRPDLGLWSSKNASSWSGQQMLSTFSAMPVSHWPNATPPTTPIIPLGSL